MKEHMERCYSLDVLKLILIVLIIFTHSALATNYTDNIVYPLIVDMAVPVFLVITGFVNAMQIETKGIESYSKGSNMIRRLLRLILPFLICAVIDVVIWRFFDDASIKDLAYNAVFQKWGKGGYYSFAMIQIVLIFPLLYRLSESRKGIVAILLINFLSEWFFGYASEVNGGVYSIKIGYLHRMLVLRYLSFLLGGILLYRYKDKISKKSFAFTFVLGVAIDLILNYVIKKPIVFRLWRTTSMPVVVYAVSWVILFLLIDKLFKNRIGITLGKIGQATYTIFLTQMMYYVFITYGIIKEEPPCVISIVLCIVVGYAWHYVDNKLQRVLNLKLLKSTNM